MPTTITQVLTTETVIEKAASELSPGDYHSPSCREAGPFSAGIYFYRPYSEFLRSITWPQNLDAVGLEHVLRKFAKYNSPKWTSLNF